tara:strand:+ start:1445 stop:1693 length:249 start_codon:yes stop_codon:yes gene_type:complete
MKYKIGDYVTVSKEFSKTDHGKWVSCSPKAAKIIKIQETPTYGPAYSLEVNGVSLPVCYWEDDIDGLISEDPDDIWRTWGDI